MAVSCKLTNEDLDMGAPGLGEQGGILMGWADGWMVPYSPPPTLHKAIHNVHCIVVFKPNVALFWVGCPKSVAHILNWWVTVIVLVNGWEASKMRPLGLYCVLCVWFLSHLPPTTPRTVVKLSKAFNRAL